MLRNVVKFCINIQATQCHQLECVQLLLENRADPNAQDRNGDTSLHYASRDGVIMILEALLHCGNINLDIKNKVFPLVSCPTVLPC